MSQRGEAAVRVCRPADVMDIVPYLLGFHPEESVVAILTQGNRVVVTLRWDLSDPLNEEMTIPSQLQQVRRRYDQSDVGFVVYSRNRDTATSVAQSLAEWGGRDLSFSYACDSANWWDPATSDAPSPLTGSASVTQTSAVLSGMSAMSSREDLRKAYLPQPSAHLHEADSDETSRSAQWSLAERVSTLDTVLKAGTTATASSLALAAELVQTSEVWIHAWRRLGSLEAREQQHWWRLVLHQAHPRHLAAVYGLAGIASWLSGDGAAASICLHLGTEQAQEPHPGLEVLMILIDTAIPPEHYRHTFQKGCRER